MRFSVRTESCHLPVGDLDAFSADSGESRVQRWSPKGHSGCCASTLERCCSVDFPENKNVVAISIHCQVESSRVSSRCFQESDNSEESENQEMLIGIAAKDGRAMPGLKRTPEDRM